MTTNPPPFDSRRWTGDLPPPGSPRSVVSLEPSTAKVIIGLILISVFILLARAAIWGLSGSPMVISAGPSLLSLELGLCAALATVLIMRRVPWVGRLTTAMAAFGFITFCAHALGYFQDLSSARFDRPTRLFVEAVRLPCFGRGCTIIPEVTVSAAGGVGKMNAPSAFAARLVPGDSCLAAQLAYGRHGFVFVHAIVRSAGDGTGSYMVADRNRAQCLGGAALAKNHGEMQ